MCRVCSALDRSVFVPGSHFYAECHHYDSMCDPRVLFLCFSAFEPMEPIQKCTVSIGEAFE